MSLLFSDAWMKAYADCWNKDEKMVQTLADNQFSGRIGYGFLGQATASGLLVVRLGKVERAGAYQAETLDWELRAAREDWKTWDEEGLGLERFGYVIAHKKLQFPKGDARLMMRTPALASAFLRSFDLMKQVKTEWP